MPQQVAAKKLNVSISTLKRRFYELDLPKWPANYALQEFCFGEVNSEAMKSSFHHHQPQNNNSNNSSSESQGTTTTTSRSHSPSIDAAACIHLKQNASYYSLYREPRPEEKTRIGTIINMYDTLDAKFIDPMTSTILREAFMENTEAATQRSDGGASCSSSEGEEDVVVQQ